MKKRIIISLIVTIALFVIFWMCYYAVWFITKFEYGWMWRPILDFYGVIIFILLLIQNGIFIFMMKRRYIISILIFLGFTVTSYLMSFKGYPNKTLLVITIFAFVLILSYVISVLSQMGNAGNVPNGTFDKK